VARRQPGGHAHTGRKITHDVAVKLLVLARVIADTARMNVTSNGGWGGLITVERPTRKTPIVTLVGL
jgi:hypothetical protein